MENVTGIEVLFLLIRDQFECKEDCLVAVLHWLMIKDGKKCVGLGDEWKEESLDGKGSEVLPAGWNSNHEVYTLRYVSVSRPSRYLLKIVKAGQSALINVLDVNEERAAGTSVNVSSYVSENFKEFSSAYVNLDELSKIFQKDVLSHFAKQGSGSCSESSGKTGKTDDSPKRQKVQDSIYKPVAVPESVRSDERGFPIIGRGDLDPFSGGVGGGMLADPSSFRIPPRPGMPDFGSFGPHGIPRGSVPPGARFDPLGPLGVGRGFAQPDPDHLPPPGYDDMFI